MQKNCNLLNHLNIFSVFTDKHYFIFVNIFNKKNVMPATQKLGQRQKAENVISNTVWEGIPISSLTGNRWGYLDWE